MVEGIDLACPDWEIQVLGQFSVTKDRQPVALPQASKRLLAWLAVYPRPQPRASVAARQWPDLRADRAAAAMRTALWTLNRAVGIALRPNPAGLQLDDRTGVDLWRCLNRARLLPRDQALSASSTGNPEPDVTSMRTIGRPGLKTSVVICCLSGPMIGWSCIGRGTDRYECTLWRTCAGY